MLSTANFETEKLIIRGEGTNLSVLIPTQGTLRTQLNILENFVTENVKIPSCLQQPSDWKVPLYKALWQQDNMYVSLSPWCDFYLFNQSMGEYTKITNKGPFGKGLYNVTIEAPYVYIGAHKDGHLFSLTLRVVQVEFQPASPISDVEVVLNSLIDDKKKPKKKGGRVSKKSATSESVVPSISS